MPQVFLRSSESKHLRYKSTANLKMIGHKNNNLHLNPEMSQTKLWRHGGQVVITSDLESEGLAGTRLVFDSLLFP